MNAIAVLDDRILARTSVMRVIEPLLPKNNTWRVIECPVLAKAEDYPPWIAKNSVAALITDQRLDDQLPNGIDHIDYKGSDVVSKIKQAMPALPIAVISSYTPDSDLKRDEAKADYVFKRRDFTSRSKAPTNIARLLRQGEAFVKELEGDLAEIGILAKKNAGEAKLSAKEKKRLRVLQNKLGLPFTPLGQDTLMAEIEDKLRGLEPLEEKARAYIAAAAP
jgi:hypothetical protein